MSTVFWIMALTALYPYFRRGAERVLTDAVLLIAHTAALVIRLYYTLKRRVG